MENYGEATAMIRDGYKEKVINPHQVGKTETYIYDNGTAKGSRVAWIIKLKEPRLPITQVVCN